MKHIHTTESAVRKIKAAATQLKKQSLLGRQRLSHSEALDRAATEAGYEHFHHVTTCAAQTAAELAHAKSTKPFAGKLKFKISQLSEHDPDRPHGIFVVEGGGAQFDRVVDDFDDLFEEFMFSFKEDVSKAPVERTALMIRECERATLEEPAYLDAYAHWLLLLYEIGSFDKAIELGQRVFDEACALMPSEFSGLIPYGELDNRPFHRLAHNLACALHKGRRIKAARLIARRMLVWWPNDNMGFRYFLTAKESEAVEAEWARQRATKAEDELK